MLNSGAGRGRVGAGLIVWHEVTRDQVNGGYLASKGYPPLELKYSMTARYDLIEDAIFGKLESLSLQRHNWPLIYGLALCYIVLVGPVGLVVGRLWRDWRSTLAVYLGVVALFGALFLVVGRQSSREGAVVYTFSCARPLDARILGRYPMVERVCPFQRPLPGPPSVLVQPVRGVESAGDGERHDSERPRCALRGGDSAFLPVSPSCIAGGSVPTRSV